MGESTTVTTWNDLALRHWSGAARPAVLWPGGAWSGAELLARAAGVARWLAGCGFVPRVGVPALVDGSPTAVALVVAGALGGMPIAPLGTRLRPAELAEAAAGLGSAGLVTTPDLIELAREVGGRAGLPVHVLPEPGDGPMPMWRPDADDVLVIVHTSGTTGAPKPVVVRHRAMVARVGIYDATMPIGPGDVFCSASPFHHTAAVNMALTVLGRGAAVVPQPRFSVEGWRDMGRLGVTHALLVPTMIDLLLEAGALADAHPRVLQYGAAPMDPGTLADALKVLPDIEFVQVYGQTEVSPVTALSPADHARPELLSTVGRAVAGVELRIERPDDDGVGELVLRAPHTFVHDEDGWRRTGDLGRMDAEGFVTLHGRTNDRIVRGGENIYPLEVERALASCPGVREVAVVGVPDRRWGEVVKAVVVATEPGAPPTLEQLREHTAATLAGFKRPTQLEVVDALPRSASGKVLRGRLIGPGADGLGAGPAEVAR